MFDRLYKRTTTGDVQVWSIEVDPEAPRYRTITGKRDGKMVVSMWTVTEARNVGRSNATTAQEQAVVEARAAWQKKQRDGYALTDDGALACTAFQCMLAQEYSHELRRAEAISAARKGELYSQPKLDGVRLIVTKDSMLSRKRRPIVAVPHIEDALQKLFSVYPDLVLDGELYSHELRNDFNQIVSLVRKTKLTWQELAISRETIQYWVYDCVTPNDALNFSNRHLFLNAAFGYLEKDSPIVTVDTTQVIHEAQIDTCYDQYLKDGFEGQMLRIDGPYEQKRSPLLLKRKEFEDKEFVVIAIEEGIGNRSGQAGKVLVEEPETGIRFRANIEAAKEARVNLLHGQKGYLGGEVTVRFNGRTPDNVPRFPRAHTWHPGGRQT